MTPFQRVEKSREEVMAEREARKQQKIAQKDGVNLIKSISTNLA